MAAVILTHEQTLEYRARLRDVNKIIPEGWLYELHHDGEEKIFFFNNDEGFTTDFAGRIIDFDAKSVTMEKARNMGREVGKLVTMFS